jgi:hypothetical protein
MCDYMRGEGQGRYTDLGERYSMNLILCFGKDQVINNN